MLGCTLPFLLKFHTTFEETAAGALECLLQGLELAFSPAQYNLALFQVLGGYIKLSLYGLLLLLLLMDAVYQVLFLVGQFLTTLQRKQVSTELLNGTHAEQ